MGTRVAQVQVIDSSKDIAQDLNENNAPGNFEKAHVDEVDGVVPPSSIVPPSPIVPPSSIVKVSNATKKSML